MAIVTVRITRSLQTQLSNQMPLFNALARLSKKQIRVSSSLLSHSLEGNISPRLLTMVLERVNNAFPNVQSFDHKGLMSQFSALKQDGINFGTMFEKAFLISRKKPSINDLFVVVEQDGEKIIAIMDDLQVQDFEFEEEVLPSSTALVPVAPRTGQSQSPDDSSGRNLVAAGPQGALQFLEAAKFQALFNLKISTDPKEIIKGLRLVSDLYHDHKTKPETKKDMESTLFRVFFQNDQQVREEVVAVLEAIGMPEEFTSHLRRFVTGNDTLKAASLDKLFGFASTYHGENNLPLQMVQELIFEQIQKGANREVVEKALELLCQITPEDDIGSVRDALEERFNRNPGIYDVLIEKAFRHMAVYKQLLVVETLEQALNVRSRLDFHVIAARILLDLYEQVEQKEMLLSRILQVVADGGMPAAVKADLEQIVVNSGEMAVPVLMRAYDEMPLLFRPTIIKLFDAIVCAVPVSAATLQAAGELLQREIRRGPRGVSTAMETGMIHLPGFPGPVRAEAYKQSLDVLFEIRHNQNAINNLITHG